jgi:hypothetical protein
MGGHGIMEHNPRDFRGPESCISPEDAISASAQNRERNLAAMLPVQITSRGDDIPNASGIHRTAQEDMAALDIIWRIFTGPARESEAAGFEALNRVARLDFRFHPGLDFTARFAAIGNHQQQAGGFSLVAG